MSNETTIRDHILDRNLMILASAGSGKTYQLGNRIIGMIARQEVDPARMVALTFTRKAAGEFADSVLTKLAKGAVDPSEAENLYEGVGAEFEVAPVLEKVVRILPQFQLGTIDSFFSQIVRGFQYELGMSGGTFELIEGQKLELAMSELTNEVLGGLLDSKGGEEFVAAFRRATMGKEDVGVADSLENFIKSWHGHWKGGLELAHFANLDRFAHLPKAAEWEARKGDLVDELKAKFEEGFDWVRKGHDTRMFALLEEIRSHTIGSGVLTSLKGMFESSLESVAQAGLVQMRYYKDFELPSGISETYRELVMLAAGCELRQALERTEGIGLLIERIDEEYERALRSRGLLSFDDVKILLGQWRTNEEARMRRELVDFRLDGRYDHWFLDEFQDTSPIEWSGLEPLVGDETGEGDSSLFIVGDKKQAIYGWRGGDVRLFDRIQESFGSDMTVAPMDQSFRSCPEVLALVNSICGSKETIARLFSSQVAERWDWKDHEAARNDFQGEARVESLKKEEMNERVVEILKEIGIGEKKIQCGILVRRGTEVAEISDHLRAEGFDVIEEGRRKPMEDCAVGTALKALVAWLADPVDPFWDEALRMSPIKAVMDHRYAGETISPWEDLLSEAREEGFAMMMERLVEPLRSTLSPFGQRRLGDILRAVEEFDSAGEGTARSLRDWLQGLEISQPPGEAAVQVMTIHKSKGLGFDVVILPQLSDDQVPDRSRYKVAKSPDGWVMQPPARWVREVYPDISSLEDQWAEDEQYEALCLLYVALTRAKQGLYVLLPSEPSSRNKADKESWSSPANMVRQTSGDWQSESNDWHAKKGELVKAEAVVIGDLAEPVQLRERSSPSGMKSDLILDGGSTGGRDVGTEVHELFEMIEWLADGERPKTPKSTAGMLVDHALAVPEIRAIFTKEKELELYREQGVEVILDGKWMSGVIDRLHVYRDGDLVKRVVVYDFKTDSVSDEEQLKKRYTGQMKAYHEALGEIYGEVEVDCVLVSTHLKSLVTL